MGAGSARVVVAWVAVVALAGLGGSLGAQPGAEAAPPTAARALALRGVRWIRRTTPSAELYVQGGSPAAALLATLPADVEAAVAADRAWLGLGPPSGPRLRLFFVGGREAMRPLVGWTPGGYAAVDDGTAFFVATPETRPALRHEVMHLLSWRAWGRPGGVWLSEGVATLAAGGCGGYAVDDVAAVLLRERALPALDTLRRAFDVRGRTGATQYLASASLVAYVDRTYGRPALRRLWTAGLAGVRGALGVDAAEVERGWHAALARHPAPRVTWAGLWTAIAARGCE